MKSIVEWNKEVKGKAIWEWFIELGNLDDTDIEIIKYRKDKKKDIKDLKIFSLAQKCNCSEDTIKKRTQRLIEKYKKLMRDYPDILTLNKEYTNVQAIISVIDKKQNYYTVEIQCEEFDTFALIREKVIQEIEKKYKISIEELGEYRVVLSGSYNRNLKLKKGNE